MRANTNILPRTDFIHPEAVLRDAGISDGMNVTHFGSGAGFFVLPAARLVGPAGRVVGVDIREQALETIQNKAGQAGLENLDAVRGDLSVLGGSHLPDDWADLIILANILHQSDLKKVLAEARRVLRPETGRILAIEWEQTHVPFGPAVDQRIAPDELLAAARLNNLVSLRRWRPSSYHYAFLFAKAHVA